MTRIIEINLKQIESIEVVKMLEHDCYQHFPPIKGTWFSLPSEEGFTINHLSGYSLEELKNFEYIVIHGDTLFVQQHIKIKMVSGKVHKRYYKSMEELNSDVDVFKSGVEEFNWKKILL